MDLEETEARNDCAGEGQRQFNQPNESVVKKKSLVVILKRLVAKTN
jgi:hypothetical protein